ncbi:MAG: phosphate transport system permease protein [Chloroflexus sp.]|uniref:phosphate ABC transporter permease subunit PstC n=1 Tax=Chloroflexus sp. TaxID=1904827 RepID=UPI0021DED1C6|nr:phosphate ABC transporter permease subunit PstC [Chloroflexus sp.]GIV89854.1 MAG: phosphate transport system permease protein [Chloroflexus sp.]
MAITDLRKPINPLRAFGERLIQIALLGAAIVSILTTVGIVFSLLFETIAFFSEVSLIEFLTETEWTPLFSIKKYGIWPLVSATVLTSAIAMLVAVPLGLISAIFLSEFASDRVRRTVKPLLEILAGIPTVVYGYFALTVVTPFLKNFIPTLSIFNSLSAGLVMGVMLIPFVASLSEDALSAVPNSLREAAYGLGSTRFEVATLVVAPAAISGIVASIVLAFSRAVGETMIVAIAAGQNPRFTFDPTVPVMTMTSYIVQVSLGDTPYGSLSYHTLYAVGFTLFLFTFVLNIFSYWMVRKFREVYD